jgi:hypothetical protein
MRRGVILGTAIASVLALVFIAMWGQALGWAPPIQLRRRTKP